MGDVSDNTWKDIGVAAATGGTSLLLGENSGQQVLDMFGNVTGFNKYKPDGSAFEPNQYENDLMQRLIQRSTGQGGPSVAELQMKQGLDQVNQNAASLAASQRGVSPALAARLAQQYGSQAGMQNNQQMGVLRAQEQVAADQSLGSLLSSQRQGKIAQENIKYNSFNDSADRGAGLLKAAGQAMAGGSTGAAKGIIIPGKAEVQGDHPMNDKVPAMLSPGEIVVPRTVAKMTPEKIAQFVKALQGQGPSNV